MLCPSFADLLRAGRPQFNAQVAAARHRYPGFNTEVFADFLRTGVDPVVREVHKINPERTGAVAVAAYDTVLDLVGRDLVGPHPHNATMNQLWSELLPALTKLLLDKPALVLGALSNALVNLESCQARGQEWLQLMRDTSAGLQTSDQLLQLGVLTAWCAGAAHFRPAALTAAQQLPAPSVAQALALPNTKNLTEVLETLSVDPWHLGQNNRQVGAFSGFGGLFPEPPQVRVNQDQFIVMSGGRCHLLMADGFGVVLLAASREEFDQGNADQPVKGKLSNNTTLVALGLPETGLRLAHTSHSLAVTSPFTFAIQLLPR